MGVVKTSTKQMVTREGEEWRPTFSALDDGDWDTFRTVVRGFNVTVAETSYALRQIHDRMLWAHDFESLADYLEAEFPFGVRMAQMITKAGKTRMLLPGATSFQGTPDEHDPTMAVPERQLRELGRLPDDLVPEAYKTAKAIASKAGRDVTTGDVKQVVDVLHPRVGPVDADEQLYVTFAKNVTRAIAGSADLLRVVEGDRTGTGVGWDDLNNTLRGVLANARMMWKGQ